MVASADVGRIIGKLRSLHVVMLKQENIYEHDKIPVYLRPLNYFGSHAGA